MEREVGGEDVGLGVARAQLVPEGFCVCEERGGRGCSGGRRREDVGVDGVAEGGDEDCVGVGVCVVECEGGVVCAGWAGWWKRWLESAIDDGEEGEGVEVRGHVGGPFCVVCCAVEFHCVVWVLGSIGEGWMPGDAKARWC